MEAHNGCKFYRFVDDTLDVIRIVRIKNSTTFNVVDTDGNKFKITKDELDSKYTKLNPDGHISLSVVLLDNGVRDVVITLHRREEIREGDSTPYVICRQNILDFFTNQIYMRDYMKYIGMSISQENCPPDIDFKNCAICNAIEWSQLIDVYMDDKFEDILSLLKTDKADNVLNNLYNSPHSGFYGYTRSVKELMQSTRFMYDFLRAFNIYPLNFKITIKENNVIPVEQVEALEDVIKCRIHAVFVTPYTKEIDLNKIEKTYLLASDIEQNLYVIAYIPGEYLNRAYDALSDHNETDMLISMIKNRRISENQNS